VEKISILPFASQVNFLDPLKTSDGRDYGPVRYRELVKECYIISKNCNTSYTDVLRLPPREKDLMLGFIVEEFRKAQENIDQMKKEREVSRYG